MNHYLLPLFPLSLVVCPGGLLPLRIFEARYLDMVKSCMKNKSSFAVIAILPEGNADADDNAPQANYSLAKTGTVMEIIDVDVTTVGMMMIRCVGQHRIKVNSLTQQANGLVVGNVSNIANDIEMPIPKDLETAGSSLKKLIVTLPSQGVLPTDIPVIEPYKFEDAAWVANRWLELLDMPIIQKQRLMQLDSPIVRLELIHDILIAEPPKLFN